jgi:hypothetical protein
VRKEPVSNGLTKRDDRLLWIDLHLGRHQLQRKLDEICGLGLIDSDYIRRPPICPSTLRHLTLLHD